MKRYLPALLFLLCLSLIAGTVDAAPRDTPKFKTVSNQALIVPSGKRLSRKFRNASLSCDFSTAQTRVVRTRIKRGRVQARPLTPEERKVVARTLGGMKGVCPRKASCRPGPLTRIVETQENVPAEIEFPLDFCGLDTRLAELGSPSHGTLTASGSRVTYVPDPHFLGDDSFAYAIVNPLAPEGAVGTVQVSVRPGIENFAGDATSLLPYRTRLTAVEALGLLHRVALGGSDELRSLARTGPDRATFVEAILNWNASSEVEAKSEFEGTLAGAPRPGFPDVLGDRAVWEPWSVRIAWSVHLLKGSGLKELALLNLHDHFATNLAAPRIPDQVGLRWAVKDHYLKLRHYALGSLREFMHEMNYDTAMGWSLDNRSNRYFPAHGSNPAATGNFNYGREVLERFTLGKDSLYPVEDPSTGESSYPPNYNEADVSSAALLLSGFDAWFPSYRAWPGFGNWNVNEMGVPYQGMGMRFHPGWRYPGGPVAIFSSLGNHPAHQTLAIESDPLNPERSRGADGLVDLLFRDHPGTAENLAYRFFGRYAYPSPPQEITQGLAEQLRVTDYDMQEFLRVVLNSSAMFSPSAQDGCIKTPAEHLALVARMARLPLNSTAAFRRMHFALVQTGHAVFEPADVFGFRQCGDRISAGSVNHGEGWLSSQSLVNRGRELWRLLDNQTDPGARTEVFEGGSHMYVTGEGANLAELLLDNPLERDPARVVDQVAQALDITLADAERLVLVGYLHKPSQDLPWDPTNQVRTRKLMRGLVWILGMHPRSMT